MGKIRGRGNAKLVICGLEESLHSPDISRTCINERVTVAGFAKSLTRRSLMPCAMSVECMALLGMEAALGSKQSVG